LFDETTPRKDEVARQDPGALGDQPDQRRGAVAGDRKGRGDMMSALPQYDDVHERRSVRSELRRHAGAGLSPTGLFFSIGIFLGLRGRLVRVFDLHGEDHPLPPPPVPFLDNNAAMMEQFKNQNAPGNTSVRVERAWSSGNSELPLWAVKPISRSPWNGGFGAESGPSQGGPCRRALRPRSG
jgi:hypothetical protein